MKMIYASRTLQGVRITGYKGWQASSDTTSVVRCAINRRTVTVKNDTIPGGGEAFW